MTVSAEGDGEEQKDGEEAGQVDGSGEGEEQEKGGSGEQQNSTVELVSTACGDYHNLAISSAGLAYSLPSPLVLPVLGDQPQPKVVQVVCGKVSFY